MPLVTCFAASPTPPGNRYRYDALVLSRVHKKENERTLECKWQCLSLLEKQLNDTWHIMGKVVI